MSLKEQQFDSLVNAAIENGNSVESYGQYDEESDQGHDVELIQYGGLWLVVERNDDDDDDITPFTDEAEARAAFDDVKAEIQKKERMNSGTQAL